MNFKNNIICNKELQNKFPYVYESFLKGRIKRLSKLNDQRFNSDRDIEINKYKEKLNKIRKTM